MSVAEYRGSGRGSGAVQSIAADETGIKKETAERAHPEAPGVQARKSHIARDDHEGHQVNSKTEQDQHDHEKDHRGAVHREQQHNRLF